MSKIWKKPIIIPEWVEVTIEKNLVKVKWPKGELSQSILDCVTIKQEENTIITSIKNDDDNKFRGLSRTLIANMIEWVTVGYEKKLLIIWVGYGAQVQWQSLVLSIGFSHKVNYEVPTEIKIKSEQDPKGNTILTLNGIDKQLIWEVTAKIRSYKKPEPYKGKGIRYFDEVIKLKAGKSAGK
jgi:large subunit ribosomal protein L6